MLRSLFICFVAIIAFPSLSLGENYEEAKRRADNDEATERGSAWLTEQWRPALSKFLETIFSTCREKYGDTYGLVFVIGKAGQVTRTYWNAENEFTSCIDELAEKTTFPKPPKNEFYYGIEFSPIYAETVDGAFGVKFGNPIAKSKIKSGCTEKDYYISCELVPETPYTLFSEYKVYLNPFNDHPFSISAVSKELECKIAKKELNALALNLEEKYGELVPLKEKEVPEYTMHSFVFGDNGETFGMLFFFEMHHNMCKFFLQYIHKKDRQAAKDAFKQAEERAERARIEAKHKAEEEMLREIKSRPSGGL